MILTSLFVGWFINKFIHFVDGIGIMITPAKSIFHKIINYLIGKKFHHKE